MELELQEVVVKPVPHTSTMADHHDVDHDTTDCEKGKSQESNLKTDTQIQSRLPDIIDSRN